VCIGRLGNPGDRADVFACRIEGVVEPVLDRAHKLLSNGSYFTSVSHSTLLSDRRRTLRNHDRALCGRRVMGPLSGFCDPLPLDRRAHWRERWANGLFLHSQPRPASRRQQSKRRTV